MTVRVAARILSSWDARHRRRTVWIGASSGDLRLRTGARVGDGHR
jgi:beta-glucosidase